MVEYVESEEIEVEVPAPIYDTIQLYNDASSCPNGGGALMSNFPPDELQTPWLDVLDDTNFGFVHLDADAETMVARYVVDNGAAVRDEVVFHANKAATTTA